MPKLILAILMVAIAAAPAPHPATMIKIASRWLSSAAKPTTLWRAGTRYARMAESPDPYGNRRLIVVHEPDAWMIDLGTKSGAHIVDPGPSFVVHDVIFTGDGDGALGKLEYGNELAFFTSHRARRSAGELIDGRPSIKFRLDIGPSRLTLWTNAKTSNPIRLSRERDGRVDTLQYTTYETNLPFDASLFQPPAGITMGK